MKIFTHKTTYVLTSMVGISIIMALQLKMFLVLRNYKIYYSDYNVALNFHVFNFGGMCVFAFLIYSKHSLINIISFLSLFFGTLFYSGLLYSSAFGILKHDQIDVFLQLGVSLLCLGWLLFFLSTYGAENVSGKIISR
jgi:hypothetical protein